MADDILEFSEWEALFDEPAPEGRYETAEEFEASKRRLQSFYNVRKAKFSDLTRKLAAYPFGPEDRRLIDAAIANVEGRFAQCDKGADDLLALDLTQEQVRKEVVTPLWFHYVEHITTMLQSQIRIIRNVIDRTKSAIVRDLAEPPKTS